MKKKRKGGSSRVLDEGESSPIVGLVASSASLNLGPSLSVPKTGTLNLASSGQDASPDMDEASDCSGGNDSSSEEICSSDEECPCDQELEDDTGLAKESLEVPETMGGKQSSGSGKVSSPTTVANAKPKMGPWRNLFADNRAANSSTLLSHFSQISESKFCILAEEDTPCDEWKRCLIGYVAGKYPGFGALKSIIGNTWKCDATLSIHENGWLVYEFKDENDKMAVLNGGPYLIYGRPLMLKSMPEFFDFSKNDMSSVPVWVKLPNLPLKCWSIRSLSKISSLIGKPIQCDRLTASKTRISYARVLIEVDLREDLPSSIEFGLPNGMFINQPVIFESLPRFCKTCHSIGHSSSNCGKTATPSAPGNSTNGVPPTNITGSQRGTRARSAGPASRRPGMLANDSARTAVTPVNAGPNVDTWMVVGRNGKAADKVVVNQVSQVLTSPILAAQEIAPHKDDAQAVKGKGKEVLEDMSDSGGVNLDLGPKADHATTGKSVTGSQSCNLGSKITLPTSDIIPEAIAATDQGPSKDMEGRKSVRKSKKTAKGVHTSSAVQ